VIKEKGKRGKRVRVKEKPHVQNGNPGNDMAIINCRSASANGRRGKEKEKIVISI